MKTESFLDTYHVPSVIPLISNMQLDQSSRQPAGPASVTMANDKSIRVLTEAKYWQRGVTKEIRRGHYLLLLLLVPMLSSLFHSCYALSNESDALLGFKQSADLNGVLSTWNSGSDVCVNSTPTSTWAGITCNDRLRVSTIWLNASGLSGTFAANTIGQLDELRYLIVSNNKFQGQIPLDIADIPSLTQLWGQNSNFSGPVPQISKTTELTKINLSGNNLSGRIPALSELTALLYLDLSSNFLNESIPTLPRSIVNISLSKNQLTGKIPSALPVNLTILDVSDNQLSGPIPSTSSNVQLNYTGNADLCGPPLSNRPCTVAATQAPGPNGTTTPTTASSTPAVEGHKKWSSVKVVAVVVADIIGLAIIFYALYKTISYFVNKSEKLAAIPKDHGPATANPVPLPVKAPLPAVVAAPGAGMAKAEPGDKLFDLTFFEDAPHKFDLENLLRASAEILGKGSLGTTYRARLDTGSIVAVKRLKDVKDMQKKEFDKHMMGLGRLRHPNLLPLRAYYYAKEEKLLVYDYIYNGSLASMLHGPKDKEAGHTLLDWNSRLNVALDVALALTFLHENCPPQTFPHQNLKSSNILLGNNYEAYLADYCLVPLMTSKIAAQGMTGYADPEYSRSKRKSQKPDVYSFGVLLLELLTGRRPAVFSEGEETGEGINLPKFVKSAVREEWTVEVFDLQLKTSRDGDAEMVTVLQMALRCVEDNPDKRPPLAQVVTVLESMRQGKEEESFVDSRSTLANGQEYDSETPSRDAGMDRSVSFS